MPASRTVQSVDRAVALLRAMAAAESDATLAELAAACGLERPTAWRLLWTLEANGLVEKAEPSRYRLSPGMGGLAPRHPVESLVRIARPVLTALSRAHEVTASLVHVQTFGLEYVDQVDGPRFAAPRWEGALSLHASSPGKAVLAALPDADRDAFAGLVEILAGAHVTGPVEANRRCRLCDPAGCGHGDDCPVTRAIPR